MARLSKEQWAAARERWENDPGLTYEALANEIGVSKPAVIGYAKRNGWSRGNVSGNKGNVSKASKNVSGNIARGNKKKHQEAVKKELKLVPVAELAPHEEKREPGRPSLYRDEFEEQAYKLCLLGATDAELADFFGVEERTINNWKIDHPSFFQSMQRGKVAADSEVASSTYLSAIGGHFVEEERPVSDGNGGTKITKIKKQVPPSYQAQSLWLRNRRPANWKERVEVKEEVTISQIPWDELREITRQSIEKAEKKHREVIEGRYERLGIEQEYHSD